MQDGKMTSKDAPPFATSSGKQAKSGDLGSSPGNNFNENDNPQSAPVPGHNFNEDHRPQGQYAKVEVVPCKDEMPEGGPVLKLDPKAGQSDGAPITALEPNTAGPWKNLK